MKRIAYGTLIKFHREILTKAGLDSETNEAVTSGLCETSLRGVDSHGIRLLPHYTRSALSGRKNPKPNYRYTQKFPAFGVLDADNTFGHAAGFKAIGYAMQMAKEFGIGAVTVCNSSHPGAMASFTLKAAREGYVAFAFTNADSLLRSHGGQRAYFGTNPTCFAAPRKEEEPFCLDMAPTIFSWNKLLTYREKGEKLPGEYAADEQGVPTSDPDLAQSILPIGTYKGYGLSAMGEVLCGVLTGMPFGRAIPAMFTAPMDKPRHLGQFYLVMRADICQLLSVFEERLQQMTDEVRREPNLDGERVLLANDPQIEEAQSRKEKGIPVTAKLLEEFRILALDLNVDLKL